MAVFLPTPYTGQTASPHQQPVPLHPIGPVMVGAPLSAPAPESKDKSAAELGVTVIRALIGGAAVLLGIVATLWLLSLAFALSATLGEAFKLGLIAMAASASLAGLPIAGALLSRNYANEASITMRGWAAVVVIAAFAAIYFTLSLTPLAESGASALRYMPRAVWTHSGKCRRPENDYQEELCAEWRHATAPAVSLLPFGGEAADNPLRRILVALLNIAALAGAGWLGRIYVLASAEAKNLPTSEAQPAPAGGPAVPVQMTDVPLAPIDTFNAWFAGSVRHDPAGMLSATEAYERYRMTCQQNGFPALTSRKFGVTMTAKAEASGGQIRKVKTNGTHFYQGLAFSGEADPLDLGVAPSAGGLRAAPARS